MNFNLLVQESPNAWNDFVEFYNSNFKTYSILDIQELPFEFLLGVYLKYFSENGVELDLSNTEFYELEIEIEKAFLVQETNRKHFS